MQVFDRARRVPSCESISVQGANVVRSQSTDFLRADFTTSYMTPVEVFIALCVFGRTRLDTRSPDTPQYARRRSSGGVRAHAAVLLSDTSRGRGAPSPPSSNPHRSLGVYVHRRTVASYRRSQRPRSDTGRPTYRRRACRRCPRRCPFDPFAPSRSPVCPGFLAAGKSAVFVPFRFPVAVRVPQRRGWSSLIVLYPRCLDPKTGH